MNLGKRTGDSTCEQPVLIKGEDILSTGDDYISSGPLAGAVA